MTVIVPDADAAAAPTAGFPPTLTRRRNAVATQAGCRHHDDSRHESDTGHMPYLEDSTPDPTHARRPDFSRVRTQGSLVVDVAGVAGRVEDLIRTHHKERHDEDV